MSSAVLDASAILAFAHREPGHARVQPVLHGAVISAVNYCEFLKKSVEHGGAAATASLMLARSGVEVVNFDAVHARQAAELWPATRKLGLSLGDRACLALAMALSRTVYTTDRRMAEAAVGVKIVLVRGSTDMTGGGELMITSSTGLVVPSVIAGAGEHASRRFIEFFTANIRNRNTRLAYAKAVADFMMWCEAHRLSLHELAPVSVSAYLQNGGTIEKAQTIAAHESPRTTKLYDRTSDDITLDEIERIVI